ncbi:beta-N-acetylglucosaminidase domain-containing protein [Streptomyces sp. NBC_01304]|uniref:beta-N-acetylglucosaminidase domain-containing protein n=1 Tax=Streptomyces sp. NBC_01304 TaxID=2903818 RepID=UPI002E14A1F9|nr:beta-N-acetylglucosaminidase domain-containing protein [Streptomyces sp. NBC_01304]
MSFRPPRAALVGAIAAVLALGLSVPGQASGAPPGEDPPVPRITPTPQSVKERTDRVTVTGTVTLVTGEQTDPAALDVTRGALRTAGARKVVRSHSAAADGLNVYVGGPSENPSSADALKALGLQGPAGLPSGGHVLGIGKNRIVLAGADATGTYYAAQSLRQLLPHRDRPGTQVRGIAVRDWPATALRGVIEGFYGTPWSHEARLDQLDFYGAHKMNIYVYSPKDDPYLREKWREPYPAEQLAKIKELVDRARERHVEFTYALSPGLSVCYSSDAEVKALADKFQTIWDIGVRTFAVPLDDISYTDWNCPADEAKWGTGGGAAGAAQAHLLNRVNREFMAKNPGAQPLQMVPTEYYDVTPSPYKKALAEQLDKDVLVEWTGIGVIAPTMTVAEAKKAREVFGHPILTWDNYPVNDYVPNRLLLGPFNGREKGLAEELAGITANPMIQPYASKIALFTVADYTWNDQDYDPRTSWSAALKEMAGGDARAERALRVFSDASYGSLLNEQQAPELAAAFKEFWDKGDEARLARVLQEFGAAPGVLRSRLPEPGFLADAAPWLDSAEAWGKAASTALRMVGASREGDGATAWKLRQELPELVKKARSFTTTKPGGGTVPVLLGDGVLDAFVDDAIAEHDRLLGVAGRPKATSTLGTYQDNPPARMSDGDDATYYWSNGAPKAGTSIGLDLRRSRELGAVRLAMGKAGSTNDYLHEGVLEYSADGKEWKALTTFSGKAEVTFTPPAGTEARYVRARATAGQDYWLVVREFGVAGAGVEVSGGPPAEPGSTLSAAADGDPATVYRAARAPQAGESLVVELGPAKALHAVTVLQTGDPVRARVQVRSSGEWKAVGELTGAYAKLPTTLTGDAVRLEWSEGSAAPRIAEIIAD